jgi:hypothetical protein
MSYTITQLMLHSYIVDKKSLEHLAEEYRYPLTELENIAKEGKWSYRRNLFEENLNGR